MSVLLHQQPKADREILGAHAHRVGGAGFVRLVRYMGSDASILQAARTSYGDGTKTIREDQKLLAYLIQNKHLSPFEQVVLVFHMKLPIFVARQLVRHRTARLNEVSARYSEMPEEFWIPKEEEIRIQSTTNKQSSDGQAEIPHWLYKRWQAATHESHALYRDLLAHGVAREQARTVLPVSLYTEWYWQMDLRNLISFLKLRDDPHAQLETQHYAQAIKRLARLVAPETMQIAFPEAGHAL